MIAVPLAVPGASILLKWCCPDDGPHADKALLLRSETYEVRTLDRVTNISIVCRKS